MQLELMYWNGRGLMEVPRKMLALSGYVTPVRHSSLNSPRFISYRTRGVDQPEGVSALNFVGKTRFFFGGYTSNRVWCNRVTSHNPFASEVMRVVTRLHQDLEKPLRQRSPRALSPELETSSLELLPNLDQSLDFESLLTEVWRSAGFHRLFPGAYIDGRYTTDNPPTGGAGAMSEVADKLSWNLGRMPLVKSVCRRIADILSPLHKPP